MEVSDKESEILLASFDAFLLPLLQVVGRRWSRDLARQYAHGLLGPGERKTAEPIVRRLLGVEKAPTQERNMREMLAEDWAFRPLMFGAGCRLVEQTTGWDAWTIDDTACLKQGRHSVGVANQYAGIVGGLANCQVLVTLGIAQEHVSTPIAMQLFLPECWQDDAARRRECHVPTAVKYEPKWKIALGLVRKAISEGLPLMPVLGDSAYGDVIELRKGLQDLGIDYVVAVSLKFTAIPAGVSFAEPPRQPGKNGRPATRLVADRAVQPLNVAAFARTLPGDIWRDVVWRHGSKGELRGRFAAARIRPGHRIKNDRIAAEELQPEQWLLMHWPDGEEAPTKAWLSNLPADTSLERLIALARQRWRIERDYREGKGLLGLDHFEGRTWYGLHHHVALVIAVQAFLALERWKTLERAREEAREAAQKAAAELEEQHVAAIMAATPPCAPGIDLPPRAPRAGRGRAVRHGKVPDVRGRSSLAAKT